MSEQTEAGMVNLEGRSAKFMGHKASSFLESGDVFRSVLEHGESEGKPPPVESPFEEAPEGDV